ncbi:MAG: hypothetical protein KAV87_41580 [Desulfobacteraceae bacterium]|nr:hypothetical protein [Desulfobacteraceae bacterium]
MTDCEYLAGCPFFNDNMTNMPTTADRLKRKYCKEDNSTCARYVIATKLGKPKVPRDLFPNDEKRTKVILEEG